MIILGNETERVWLLQDQHLPRIAGSGRSVLRKRASEARCNPLILRQLQGWPGEDIRRSCYGLNSIVRRVHDSTGSSFLVAGVQ